MTDMNNRQLSMKNIGMIAIGVLFLVAACSKEEDQYRQIDYNRLGYLISDNQNLATFSAILQRSSLKQELTGAGKFTVLVPSDAAFLEEGYTPESVAAMSGEWISEFLDYHTMDGYYDFEKLPFRFNQPIRTRNGHVVFATRWVWDGDTAITVNGKRVLAANVSGSNGYAHIVDKFIQPNTYSSLSDRLASISTTTMFSHAVYRSGLEETILKDGQYTLFVPTNQALLAAGFASIEDVEVTHPDTLAALIKRHLLPGIRFTYDHRMTTPYIEVSSNGVYFDVDYYDRNDKTVKSEKTYNGGFRGFIKDRMVDGREYYFYYTYGNSFSANGRERLLIATQETPYYQGSNGAIVLPQLSNQLADNGVFHVINRVLEP